MNKIGFVAVCLSTQCATALFSQTITLYDPVTETVLNEGAGARIPNTIQFKVANLLPPAPDPESERPPRWEYFWDFGDCSYPGTDAEPIHTYAASNAVYEVRLTLTPIYSGEDEELPEVNKTISLTGPFSSAPPGEEVKADFKPGKSIGIHNVRDCKPGDLNTFLLPFKNTTGAPITTGHLRFTYPVRHLDFDSAYLNECGYDPPYNHSVQEDTTGAFVFNFSDLAPDEVRFVAVTLLTRTGAELGASVPLTAQWYNSVNTLLSADTLLLEVVNSHDPNQKSAFREKSCMYDSVSYTIQFENEGTADAELVYVIDHIDSLLDIMGFSMRHTTHGSLPVTVIDSIPVDSSFNPHVLSVSDPLAVLRDTVTRNMAFVFHGIVLPPQGKGAFSYMMPLVSANIPVDTEFGGHADIYFDDNLPIATGAAISRVSQCGCLPGGTLPSGVWIDRLTLNELDNKSGRDDGYGNYRYKETTLWMGEEYSLTLYRGSLNEPASVHWSACIDFNRDGFFTAGECWLIETAADSLVVPLWVPSYAIPGETTLRIILSTDSVPFVCGDVLPGEMEDYTVRILNPELPNLLPLDAGFDKRIPPGTGGIPVSTTVHNEGPADMPQGVMIAYYLSPDAVYTPADLLLAQHALPGLPAGQTVVDSTVLTLPAGCSGTQYILVVTDPGNGLPENLELDNTVRGQCNMDSLRPDLRLNDAQLCQSLLRPGQQFRFSCAVTNEGDAPALTDEYSNTLKLYLSANEVIDGADALLTTAEIQNLYPAQGSSISLSVQLPEDAGGLQYIIAQADADSNYREYMENNNTACIPVVIAGDFVAMPPYFTGFECGGLDAFWSVPDLSHNSVSVTGGASHEGGYHLRLSHGGTVAHAADLHINLLCDGPLALSFWWKDGDPQNKNTADGLFLSTDEGVSFTKLLDLYAANSLWNHTSIPLLEMLVEQGLELSENAILRFQYAGGGQDSSASLMLDEVEIAASDGKNSCRNCIKTVHLPTGLMIYPNPVNQAATICYEVEQDNTPVSISIHTLSGQRVSSPLSGVNHHAGKHCLDFSGDIVPAGMYFCVLQTHAKKIAVPVIITH